MTAEKEPNQFGPRCVRCGHQDKVDEFCSEGWESIVDNSDCVNNPEGSARTIWLCPKCIREMEIVRMKDKELEDIAPLIEKLEKTTRILAQFSRLLKQADEERSDI